MGKKELSKRRTSLKVLIKQGNFGGGVYYIQPKVCHGGLMLVRDDLLLCVLEQIFYLAPRETERNRAICIAKLA